MSQFDLYRDRATGRLLVDCQSDLMRHLPSRFVIPLGERGLAPIPMPRFNPTFEIQNEHYVLLTQFASSVALSAIEQVPGSLEQSRFEIVAAIDMLIGGV